MFRDCFFFLWRTAFVWMCLNREVTCFRIRNIFYGILSRYENTSHQTHDCSHMTIHISTHQTSARQLTSSYSHTLTHLHTFALTYYKTDFLLQKRSFSNLGHSRVPPTRWSGLPPGLASLCVVSRPGQRGEGRGLETSLPSSDEDLIAG